jgi:hypothetical protein
VFRKSFDHGPNLGFANFDPGSRTEFFYDQQFLINIVQLEKFKIKTKIPGWKNPRSGWKNLDTGSATLLKSN